MTSNTAKDPTICERCAHKGPTCCQVSGHENTILFPLSAAESDKISLCTGLSDEEFKQTLPNSASFISSLRTLLPGQEREIHAKFPSGGVHDQLATRENGQCVFLGAQGCVLPRDVRPLYCLLFPFWVQEGKILLMESSTCAALQQSHKVQELLLLLNTSGKELITIYNALLISWELLPE